MADPVTAVRSEVRAVFAGRAVVCAGGLLAGMTPLVAELRAAGATRVLCVPTGTGTGPLPEGDDVEVVPHELPPVAGATEQFRQEERWAADPPGAIVDAVARFAGDHPLLLAPAFSAVRTFGPFRVYGARRPEWVALEDKTACDAHFDEARVPRPAATVVAAGEAALARAHATHDHGSGTVWAGDARDGFNGGAEYVRWVRDDTSRRDAVEFFAPRCARVRVAPFVEGIPCSVHGFVNASGAVAFRPVEMVVLRTPAAGGLRYAGAATFYDPPAADREAMRDAAVRLGRVLFDLVGFRGWFTIDGICSTQGWVATECNPRPGAGLGYLGAALPEILPGLAHRVASEGALDDLDPDALAALVVARADASRWGGAWMATTTTLPETHAIELVAAAGSRFRRAVSGEMPDAQCTAGPGPAGGFVRVVPAASRTPAGPSIAPVAVAGFAWADAELGTGFGPLAPAPEPRRARDGDRR
jgi:hypothetical protein